MQIGKKIGKQFEQILHNITDRFTKVDQCAPVFFYKS